MCSFFLLLFYFIFLQPWCFRLRILVEEEGEVFRKGIVLLGPEEMEGDYAGEDLRRGVYFFYSLHKIKKIIDTLLRY